MTFKTKKILNNNNFEQNVGESLILSGDTYISSSGSLRYLTSPTITGNTQIPDVNYITGLTSNYYDKIEIANLIVSGATNGLTRSGNNVILGGTLTGNTEIVIGTEQLSTYLGSSGFNIYTGVLILQPDNKILVGGSFTTYSGVTRNRIIRLNSNGSIDNTFSIGTGFNNRVRSITLQPDNKILVGGDFTTYSGVTRNRIIRLNSNGSIDNTFSISTGFDANSVYSIILQPDNKILVGGQFTTYSGVSANGMIRLNSNGSIDNTFSIGSGFDYGNAGINSIILQPDNKILVGGYFLNFSGVTVNRIVRLNSNGSIDNSFNMGTGFDGDIYSMNLQPDNKILVGGDFTTYSGVTRNGIIRLNSNGSIDNTFSIGTGFDTYIYSLILQSDNKILVGGSFTTYSGVTVNRIVRLNSNGSIDNTFSIDNGFDSYIYSLILQSDNKILVGGNFTFFSGFTATRIVRLNSNGYLNYNTLSKTIILKNNALEYGNNYSSAYTSRSIPDVGYVTGLTSQKISTANNGLTKSANNVRLGGALTGNTSLTGGYSLNICGGAKLNTTCGYQISGTTIFRSSTKTNTSIYLGVCAGSNGAGLNNSGIGFQSLSANTTGCNNFANGRYSLVKNTIGKNNIANGYQSLYSNTCGSGNTTNGYQSMSANTTGCNNFSNGYKSLTVNTSGSNNIAFGYKTLYNNTTSNNIAFGYQSLSANTTGSNNNANGFQSLVKNTIGTNNIANGYGSLFNNISGSFNIGISCQTLCSNTIGNNNIAIGNRVLFTNNKGNDNIGNGQEVLYFNISGNCNIGIGYRSLYCNITGSSNMGIGYSTLYCNQYGSNNIALGCYSGYKNVTGSSNVFIGKYAGYGVTTSNKLYIANQTGSTLIYGDFNTNEVTLPILKLCTTPSSGTSINDYVVWDSSSKYLKTVKQGVSNIITLTGNTLLDATYSNKIIEADGTLTITLPDSMIKGMNLDIINISTGTTTLSASTTLVTKSNFSKLTNQWGGASVYHRGSNIWWAGGDLSA